MLEGPPPKIASFKRGDIDRIYSEYVQVTLKAAEAEAAKSSKADAVGHPEKPKRKQIWRYPYDGGATDVKNHAWFKQT